MGLATDWGQGGVISVLANGISGQLIHIAGRSCYGSVSQALADAWLELKAGGIILLDDALAIYSNPIWQAIQDFLRRFDATSNMVEYQYLETLRGHYLIRKVD